MQNDIYLIGEIGWEVTLDSVIKSVEASDKTKPLDVHIHSGGGSVYDGLAIYNYFKGLDQEVNTISSGLVASIASIIFLAGKKENRKINSTDSFLIHLPMNFGGGTAEEIEKTAKELRDIEGKLADIYANETDLTKEEAIEQMKLDEMIDVNWLKEKGFISEIIEFKAVAKFNKNDNTMNKDKDELKKGLSKIDKIFAKLGLGPKAKLVTDASGKELDFPDVAEDATPVVGDKATVDGTAADGSFIMPSEDEDKNGETWVFVAGEFTEILPPEDESGDDAEALKTENESLKQEIADLKATASTDKETTDKLTAKLQKEMKKITAKLGSNFEYSGKTNKKKTETGARSFHGNK